MHHFKSQFANVNKQLENILNEIIRKLILGIVVLINNITM